MKYEKVRFFGLFSFLKKLARFLLHIFYDSKIIFQREESS